MNKLPFDIWEIIVSLLDWKSTLNLKMTEKFLNVNINFSTDQILAIVRSHYVYDNNLKTKLMESINWNYFRYDKLFNKGVDLVSIAAKIGSLKILKILIRKGFDMHYNNDEPFVNACKFGHVKIVRYFVYELNFNPALLNNISIREAAIGNQLDVVRFLLQDSRVSETIRHRVNPSAGDFLSFKWAVLNQNLHMVKVLLMDFRVNPTTDKNYPIRIASQLGNENIVKTLLQDSRVNPSVRKFQSYKWAFERNNLKILDYLMSDYRVWSAVYFNNKKLANLEIKNMEKEKEIKDRKTLIF
ncbi:hypothetical protein HK099_007840 [Clydaea vesicula]|uniref:Ankyrin repeat protein n=1 Tax=Clydaea vesicula TaxID=447962 RepID=A0AAD5U7X9_9FUNG|nr:hypothetical protein HK099_007840 [Clydaea vesicula]